MDTKICVRCQKDKILDEFPLKKPPFIYHKECNDCYGSYKFCSGCEEEKLITEFPKKYGKNTGKFHSKCKKCRRKRYNERRKEDGYFTARSKERRQTIPNQAFEYMGGKCANPNCPIKHLEMSREVFDYHHIDPSQKDYNISRLINKGVGWLSVKKELDKCVMLCCLCHRTLHAGQWELKDSRVIGN